MTALVAVRRGAFNNAPTAISASPVFHVIATRISSPDVLTVVLRGEFDGPLEAAKRHALGIAQIVAKRYGCPALGEVVDSDNVLLYAAEVKA